MKVIKKTLIFKIFISFPSERNTMKNSGERKPRRDSCAIKGITLGVVIISLNLKKVSLLQN